MRYFGILLTRLKQNSFQVHFVEDIYVIHLGQYLSTASFNVYFPPMWPLDISCRRNPMNAWHGTPVAWIPFSGSMVASLSGKHSVLFLLRVHRIPQFSQSIFHVLLDSTSPSPCYSLAKELFHGVQGAVHAGFQRDPGDAPKKMRFRSHFQTFIVHSSGDPRQLRSEQGSFEISKRHCH